MIVYRIGTRASPLARAQALAVQSLMEKRLGLSSELVNVSSKGDEQLNIPLHTASSPGLFTRSLERALENNEVDLAVHSLKDLPLEQPPDLPVIAVPTREKVGDLLLVKESHHDPQAPGLPIIPCSRVGTSAPRRQAYLMSLVPRAIPVDVRGNVGTRLRKLEEGWVDGLLMARAAFERLGDLKVPPGFVKVTLDPEQWPCAPGQGALAIQCRAGELLADRLAALDHPPTRQAITAERALLAGLGGGCGLPLGVHAKKVEEGTWRLTAAMAGSDWRQHVKPHVARLRTEGDEPLSLAKSEAKELLGQLVKASQRKAAVTEPETLASPGQPGWLVAGTPETSNKYADHMINRGFRAAPYPMVEIEPLLDPEAELPSQLLTLWRRARWVLVSSARAAPTLARLEQSHPRPDLQFGAVSRVTAQALRQHDFPVHLVSPSATAASLASELIRLKGEEAQPILMPGAAKPAPDAPMMLERAGLEIHPWAFYRTKPSDGQVHLSLPPPLAGVILLSPSAVQGLKVQDLGIQGVGTDLLHLALGPTTASALNKAGLPCHGVAEDRSPEGILQLIQNV